MASKFGGIPVEEEQPKSKFGGVPVAAASVPGMEKLGGAPPGIPKPASGMAPVGNEPNATDGGAGGNGPQIPAIVNQGLHQLVRSVPSFSNSIRRGFSDLIEGGAKTAAPLALPALVSNPLATLSGAGIGAGVQAGAEATSEHFGGSPDTTRLVGNVSGALLGPLLSKGLGKLIGAPAPTLAKSALGINGRTEAYGATPGRAILEETSGIRPADIEDSARGRLRDLNTQLEGAATAAGNRGTKLSLKPARDVIAGKSANAAAANSEGTPRELAPMAEQLTQPRPGFTGATEYPAGAHTPITITPTNSPIAGPNGQPIPGQPILTHGPSPSPVVSEQQPPMDFLGMKRQFDKDFIRNWSPAANTKGALGTARQGYGAMADEFNAHVPGAAPLNQRISSLVPVAERARLTDMNAGVGERMLSRAARPTGGLFPLLFGYHEGGIPGALAAIGGTEGISSPEVKMIGARTLFGAGKGLGSPAAATGAAVLPLVRRRDSGARQ